jgi:hypothetical protein
MSINALEVGSKLELGGALGLDAFSYRPVEHRHDSSTTRLHYSSRVEGGREGEQHIRLDRML